MQVTPAWNSFIRSEAYVVQLSIQQGRITVFLQIIVIALLFLPFALQAQNANQPPFGIAWRVSGVWQIEGEKGPISTGDAIVPESLLRPGEGTRGHSITVLLPDGQRILYECFTPQDCVRGFRVPSLYRMPKPIAIDLLARANSVLPQQPSPGVLSGDTEVSLHCDTPGASMHYTVDGSQPSDTSAVYRAPIVVKGTALTIKAFATSKGKKDSPVVTGIFRIGD
jgi:hypothetical protein